jgi:hypothetical protein
VNVLLRLVAVTRHKNLSGLIDISHETLQQKIVAAAIAGYRAIGSCRLYTASAPLYRVLEKL